MIHEIITYPDNRLNEVSKEVTEFDSTLHTLLDDMLETMNNQELEGLGLASIQIGVPLRVVIIAGAKLIEAINPVIKEIQGIQHGVEICLSVPNVLGIVERADRLVVSYQDRDGKLCINYSTSLLARVWQHEIEHLNGGLYIDNLAKGKLKQLKRQYSKRNK